MPRRREVIESEPEPTPAMPLEAGAKPVRESKPRLTIPLTQEGGIDFDSMRGETRKKVMEFLSSETVKTLSAEPQATPFSIDRKNVPAMYDTLAVVIGRVTHIAFKWPEELCKHIHYSEEQKERLTEPTAAMIEHYAPAWLMQHQVLVAFAVTFGSCTYEMLQGAVRSFAIEQMAKRATNVPSNGGVTHEPVGDIAGAGM